MTTLLIWLVLILPLGGACYHYRRKLLLQKKQSFHLLQQNQILEVEVERLKLFRKVVHTSPQLFLLVDQSLQVVLANKVAKSFGWKRNHQFTDISNTEDSISRLINEIKRTLELGQTMDSEIRLNFKANGKYSYFIYQIFPVKDEEDVIVGAAISALDVTEKKRLEAELQISKARQLEASRLATLGETAGGIAHEINNPLNVLVGVAELMKMILDKEGTIETTRLHEYSDKIIKFSMRIAKIIKGLRAISRDASGDPFSEVDLVQIVDEALELCQQQFLNRGITLHIQKCDHPLIVQGRLAQISQIIMNILNNARDATEGLPNAQIFVEISKHNEQALLRIWDSGAGIPTEIENQIMNPFFTTKPVGKGTGLGLSISRAIADEHKGTLHLNRSIAASCFELVIPLSDSSQSEPGEKSEAA